MTMQSELPETVIQRLQSLLSSKQAAQTTLLSKSWHSAFLTRPNLDFDHTVFLRSGETVPFWEYASNTIAKYAESNRKIRSFRIRVRSHWHCEYTRLILRALEIGATHLTIQFRFWGFMLPEGVLASEDLVALTLRWAKINPQPKVRCSMLRSLCLENVFLKFSDLFSGIILTCPMIQNLSLSHIQHENGSRYFQFDEDEVDVAALALTSLRRLRSLVLVHVNFDTLFLQDLSFNFPVLQDLTLHRRDKEQDIIISSRSLERLEIKLQKRRPCHGGDDSSTTPRVQFDLIPSIRKFCFEGAVIPSLYFRSHFSTTQNRFMNGLNDGKEVSTQIFDKVVSKWRDVPLESLLDGSTTPKGSIRLNWQLAMEHLN